MSNSIFDYSEVVSDLRKNFYKGVLKTCESRLKQLKQLKKFVDDNEKELYDAVYKDLHKCKTEAHLMEVLQVRIEIGHAIQSLQDWMKPQRVKPDLMNIMNTAEINYQPYGVSLIIGAWNYPIGLVLLPLIGAIAAGNCAVLKPSELSENTANLLERLLPKYISKDCLRVINGGVSETSALLRERFDHIFYTGGTFVAKIIMKAASEHLTPVVLELGGKCPAVVDATCDFDAIAQRIVWAKFANAGQTCLAVDYILCVGKVQEKLVDSLKKAIIKFYGEDMKKSASYGRIINKRHFQRVCKLINKQKVAFGNIIDEDELYVSPTILFQVTKDDAVMQEEIFGPILPLISVDSVEEAVNLINNGEKPLALYAFSKNWQTIDFIESNTSSGGFCANDAIVHAAVPNLPFGGIGYSGMGAYHCRFSFECFSHRKACLYKNQMLESANSLRYPPYDENWKMLKFLVWLITPTAKPKRSWLNLTTVAFLGVAMAFVYFVMKKQNLM